MKAKHPTISQSGIYCLVGFFFLFSQLGDAAAHDRSFSRIVAFGASLADPGNFYVLESKSPEVFCVPGFDPKTNFAPYQLLSENPLEYRIPDRPYATGGKRFTNGPTFVEVLGRRLHLAASTGPALSEYRRYASNYAYAVAGARATNSPCLFNLGEQMAAFKADFGVSAPESALYVFEIGGNDVRDAMSAALTGGDPNAVLKAALEALGQTAYELYTMGARNFLFLNAPHVGRLPAVRILDDVVPVDVSLIAGGLAQGYNAGLADLVKGVRHWPGVRAAKTLDVYQKFNDMLDHPERYGFTNTTETCVTPNVVPYDCREPDEYVFWDGIHPTRAVHAVFGEAAAKMVGGKKAKEGRH